MNIKLEIKAYDEDGMFRRRAVIEHQLNSDTLGNIYLALFGYFATGASSALINVNDIFGAGVGLRGVFATVNSGDNMFNSSVVPIGTSIQLGTGVAAATRADTANNIPITGIANLASIAYAAGVLNMAYTIVYGVTKNPTEAILIWNLAQSNGNPAQVAIDHAVFANIGPGVTFTLTYQLALD